MIEKIVKEKISQPSQTLANFISPLAYLTKDEFMKKYREIINDECKKTFPSSISRDLKDSQIDTIGEQLFEIYKGASFDEMTIYNALKQTENLESRYDRAVRIKQYLDGKLK